MGSNAKMYEVECAVNEDKFMAYAERSMIEENRALILSNYAAAFTGNRQMTISNTDSIFKNRIAILSSLPVEGALHEHRDSMIHEAKLDFLEHRCALNGRVAAVNESLAAVNAL